MDQTPVIPSRQGEKGRKAPFSLLAEPSAFVLGPHPGWGDSRPPAPPAGGRLLVCRRGGRGNCWIWNMNKRKVGFRPCCRKSALTTSRVWQACQTRLVRTLLQLPPQDSGDKAALTRRRERHQRFPCFSRAREKRREGPPQWCPEKIPSHRSLPCQGAETGGFLSRGVSASAGSEYEGIQRRNWRRFCVRYLSR